MIINIPVFSNTCCHHPELESLIQTIQQFEKKVFYNQRTILQFHLIEEVFNLIFFE